MKSITEILFIVNVLYFIDESHEQFVEGLVCVSQALFKAAGWEDKARPLPQGLSVPWKGEMAHGLSVVW